MRDQFKKLDVPITPSIIGEAMVDFFQLENKLDEFYDIYKTMPQIDNTYGMKSPHLFLLWNALKQLSPKVIIESGVYKGLGTWWIEQSCPNAQVFCIDPDFSNIEYKSLKAVYLNEDFFKHIWIDIPKNDTVIFFDDHQNALTRLMQMKWMGFKKAIFDDNYSSYSGDCYSCKKIFAKTGNQWAWDLIPPNTIDDFWLNSNIKTYQEFPAPFRLDKNRFGYNWNEKSLLEKAISPVHNLLLNEASSYTYMCFIELI